MNILRWRRKSKKKIKFKTILLFIFSLIMTTFAWFAYSKVLQPTLNMHISSWDMQYFIGEDEKENPIGIGIGTLYPAMPEQKVKIDIKNNGDRIVDIDYYLTSISIVGETYQLIAEGQEKPAEGKYIVLTQAYTETDATTGEKIVRGTITNDITKFPFTIEIEHSGLIYPKTIDAEGNETGGEGYLTVRVNWSGDNSEFDSEWGYIVGEYLATGATSAITMNISIEAYQVETITDETVTMPVTSQTIPYLPTGFTRVAGTTLDTGLVIKDATGNEYVWIEVPRSTAIYPQELLDKADVTDDDCSTIESSLKTYSSEYRTLDDVYSSSRAIGLDETEYNTLKNNMLKSVFKNGGFYIGRYETGIMGSFRKNYVITTEEVPVIKPNAYPYNFVSCSQAQSLSSNMASGEYTSSLMFGLQWDLVLKYLETKGSATSEQLTTDSVSLGNYYNNIYYILNKKSKYLIDLGAAAWTSAEWGTPPYEKLTESMVALTTGANSLFSKQNIYDLAGNVSEWTFNINKTNSSGGNGGDYTMTANNIANYRASYAADTGVKQVGFRVTIY